MLPFRLSKSPADSIKACIQSVKTSTFSFDSGFLRLSACSISIVDPPVASGNRYESASIILKSIFFSQSIAPEELTPLQDLFRTRRARPPASPPYSERNPSTAPPNPLLLTQPAPLAALILLESITSPR